MTNICCFTGHRSIPPNKLANIQYQLEKLLKKLINQNIKIFICGGAVGFDILCGEMVLKLKKNYEDLSLLLVLPCKNQDKYYNSIDKSRYAYLVEHADKIIYTSETYFSGCMHKRNRYMVVHSKYIISYCTKNSGGSYYTQKYAISKNLSIFNIL